jgi:16S rRNA (guanine1207-N2)-methyltransferase
MNSLTDQFFKKRIDWCVDKRRMSFDVPIDVFASHQLDPGTELLIKLMNQAKRNWPKSLDIGCGYGPISIWLLTMGKSESVDGIERDWIAGEYAKRNAERAKLLTFRLASGLAFQNIEKHAYDLIVSNVPAKAGPQVHRMMLLGASDYLRTDGQVWIVVVTPLRDEIEAILSTEGVNVFHRTVTSQHTVYGYSFTKSMEPETDPYLRGVSRFSKLGVSYEVEALQNLDEFDNYAYGTELVCNLFAESTKVQPCKHLAVWNPTQGHLAIISTLKNPSIERVTLLSRDGLELEASCRNLRKSGFSGTIHLCHGIELPDEPIDTVMGSIHEKEGLDLVVNRVVQMRSLSSKPRLILSSKSSFHGQLTKRLEKASIKAGKVQKESGFSASIVHPRSA